MTSRLIVAAAALALLAACTEVEYGALRSEPRSAHAAASLHERGRAIYNFRCYYCHGYSGDARTLASTFLTPAPRDFTASDPARLTRQDMLAALRQGRPGTAMAAFAGILSEAEMQAVVDFVRQEFMVRKAVNTRYHTPENGWPDHERYRDAFPFATGAIGLDVAWDRLTAGQQRGKRLYLASCVSCHDRGRPVADPVVWDARPLSYPRNNYQPGTSGPPDAISSASPYGLHDIPPKLAALSAQELLGERLFQANCAFCHAADGTGKNWIGSFMEPHPRNLTDPQFMGGMTRARLRTVIRDGLPDTSMPAWGSVLEPPEIDAVIAYISRAFHPVAD